MDNGVVRSVPDGSLEDNRSFEGKECRTGLSTILGSTMEEVFWEEDDLVRERANRACNGKDGGKDGEDGMEFEWGGGIATSS